jgi:hypothetical protein
MNDLSMYEDKDIAADYLSTCLQEGSLVLFLGAGASKGFGLPDWVELINELRADVRINRSPLLSTASAEELQRAADQVQKAIGTNELITLVEKVLYNKIVDLKVKDVFDKHLLVGLASLLMGSKRGHVTRVVTLNYDSMLEWFLSLFGFMVNSISQLPAVEGSEDVRIYHIHGYVPHPSLAQKNSTDLILGMEAIDRRLGKMGDLWFELTRHILYTGNCLFIGMSTRTMRDRALSVLLVNAADTLKILRPTGVWLVMEELDEDTREEYLQKNIIPLKINNLEELVEFIFDISQKAMKSISK